MVRNFLRILLATIAGVALCGITACDQPAPTEQAEMGTEETAEVAAPPAEQEAMAVEEAEPEEEATE
jgi:hypothetical protein